MKKLAIQVQDLSKAYQIGEIGTGTITRDIQRWWVTKVQHKEDPFHKVGETNNRAVKGNSDVVWSLRDVNFEINQGDAVGIIGRNGAGKSTLLKVLSRVTTPTKGRINIKGRVASLLEVGTGFHPELTGRENIYLNGAILGMRKKEIDRKFDEIVDFSAVERYIETPVKRYSSGMYVRLAFAVAAHLESEILIVDEVLAVGDIEFQRKCIDKMGDLRTGGRTLLFVSHNLDSISKLCTRGIVLNYGQVEFDGNSQDAVSTYIEQYSQSYVNEVAGEHIHCKSFECLYMHSQKELSVSFLYERLNSKYDIYFVIAVKSVSGLYIFCANNIIDNCFISRTSQNGEVSVIFENLRLLPGKYVVTLGVKDATGNSSLANTSDIAEFIVENDFVEKKIITEAGYQLDKLSQLSFPYTWYENGQKKESENLIKIFGK